MESNDELVDYLVEEGYIKSDRVEEAFRKVNREDFVSAEHQGHAYHDRALPISGNATISAPHMVAINTELLEVKKDSRVLEIGSGSGYQAAILAELTDNEVVGVEIIENLVKNSKDRLREKTNINILHGNGFKPLEGNFDRILYSCAVDSFEDAKKHIKEDSVILAPIKGEKTQVLKKYKSGEVTSHDRVKFVPFVEEGLK